jgi:tetratricopeptide (TPR) repeat protein
VRLVVAAAAVGTAAVTAGAAWLTSGRPPEPKTQGRSGPPPLALDLRGRVDAEAAALRRGQALYIRGRRGDAAIVFRRYDSIEAQVGAAFSLWPRRTVERLAELARTRPRSGPTLLNLGIALFWEGRSDAAQRAWRAASQRDPDSYYAVRADDFLHPNYAPGLPAFVPSAPAPAAIRSLPPLEELRALRRAARSRDAPAKLRYGAALQTLDHPLSAEREFVAAAQLAPENADAQVAAAVGRFRKSDPARAFSRLGPLARRFPRAPTVRFHLGLLLLWIGQVDEARRQLNLAIRQAPNSTSGREATRLLLRLRSIRTE